jgi:hypothetical protein
MGQKQTQTNNNLILNRKPPSNIPNEKLYITVATRRPLELNSQRTETQF